MRQSVLLLGRYHLVERLGEGGMAEVWKANVMGPQGFARTVVVKRVLPHLVRDPAFVKMFLSEARLSARLTHANIVQVFELGEANGEYFMSMEYVRGRDLVALLRSRSKTGPLPIGAGAYVTRDVCRGLEYAHTLTDDLGRPMGLIHRDVSLSNVMIGFDGSVKLLDFGVAKALGEVGDHKTATGMVKGKFAYMAPEQVEGLPIDHRADLFSAGVILYETLTNRRLFKGENDMHTLSLVRTANVPKPSATNPEVPPELDEVCLKALARKPEDRFASCGELAAALDEAVHRTKWGPERMGALMREMFPESSVSQSFPRLNAANLETATLSTAPELAHAVAGLKTPRRALWAGGFAGLALAGYVLWISLHRDRRSLVPSDPPLPSRVATAPLPPVSPTVRSPSAPPPQVTLHIDSRPQDAEVFFAGEGAARGRTPLDVTVPRAAAKQSIRLVLGGYDPASTEVETQADGWVQLTLQKKQRSHSAKTARSLEHEPAPAPKHREVDSEIPDPFAN